MLTAEEFIEAVEAQALVPDAILTRLRRKLTGGSTTPSAQAAATFLVQAGAITQEQADAILQLNANELELVDEGGPSGASSIFSDSPPPEDDAPEVVYTDDVAIDEIQDSADRDPDTPIRSSRRKHLKKANANEFDSPWFLIGGGALALLILVGGALALLIGQGSGDEAFRAAQESYEAGSLQQAIARFEKYVEDYPAHGDYSVGRVRLTMARIRQALDTAVDPDMALQIAETEVPQIEDEPAFGEERTELAALLPRIALGLAERSDEASKGGDNAAATAASEGAKKAMAMIANTKYVPKSFREESELEVIRALLARVDRRSEALAALDEVVGVIVASCESGDLRAAYSAHAEFLEAHPSLADQPSLSEALDKAAAAERAAASFVEDPVPAETEPAPSPVQRTIAILSRLTNGSANTTGAYVTEHQGFAYALRASDGSFLWRRPVGVSRNFTPPTPLGDQWLLVDHTRKELVLVDGDSGDERWRAPLSGGATRPVALDSRVLVTTDAGELLAINAESGERQGTVRFAQPLATPPLVDEATGKLYVVGEQSSLYTLENASLDCLDVRILAHATQSIVSPPVLVDGLLVLFENVGLETASMRVFRRTDDGAIADELESTRLEGAVTSTAIVAGRKLVVATTSGEVSLFEFNADPQRSPITLLGKRAAVRTETLSRSVAYHQRAVWIAEDRLFKAEASLANSRLVVQPLAEDFSGDFFAGVLDARDGVVLHSRQPKKRNGLNVAATDADSGDLIWEVEVSANTLGPPEQVARPPGLVTVTDNGRAHLVGRDEINAALSEEPIVEIEQRLGLPTRFADLTTITSSRIVLTTPGCERFGAIAIGPRSASLTRRLPGKLATTPAAFSGGWLAPLSLGQVLLLDATGSPLAAPFQPELKPGEEIAWRAPAASSLDDQDIAVLSDNTDTVYCLQLDEGAKALRLASSHRVAGQQPVGPIAIAGSHALVGLNGGLIAVYSVPELEEPQNVSIGGEIRWGPHPVEGGSGSRVLLATSANELLLVDLADAGRIVWRQPTDTDQLLGAPIGDAESLIVTSATGTLERRSLPSGEVTAQIDLGQTLSSGPVETGSRLVLAAADGVLLVVSAP